VADIIKLSELTVRYPSGRARNLSPMRDAVWSAIRELQGKGTVDESHFPEYVNEYLSWERSNSQPHSLYPWETVVRLMNSYKQSLNGYSNRSRNSEELQPARDMITKWEAIASQQDLSQPIGPAVEALEVEMDHLQKECNIRPEYGDGTSAIRAAATEVYLDMMAGSHTDYQNIPSPIRSYVNTYRRSSAWDYEENNVHTMFGEFAMAQSSPDDFGEDIPLLQLQSDDMMSWCWGDVGSVAFGISPKDLKNHKWQNAWGLFQGH